MYAIGVGLTTVIIAYSVLYLILSRKFKFRFSLIVIISSIVISSYLTGVVQLKFLPSVVRTASGAEAVKEAIKTAEETAGEFDLSLFAPFRMRCFPK